MKPEDLGRAYDLIADKWDSPEFNKKNGIDQHKRALAFLENRRSALDVGCGCSGRLIDRLINYRFEVEGVDISQEMLKRASKRHPAVDFHFEDICTWEIPGTYDFITAWDSIWHVPLAEHESVLSKLFLSLNTGGVCIFSEGGLDESDEMRDSYMGPEVYYSSLGIPRTLELISESGCICRHFEYDQYPELHVYYIVQKA